MLKEGVIRRDRFARLQLNLLVPFSCYFPTNSFKFSTEVFFLRIPFLVATNVEDATAFRQACILCRQFVSVTCRFKFLTSSTCANTSRCDDSR